MLRNKGTLRSIFVVADLLKDIHCLKRVALTTGNEVVTVGLYRVLFAAYTHHQTQPVSNVVIKYVTGGLWSSVAIAVYTPHPLPPPPPTHTHTHTHACMHTYAHTYTPHTHTDTYPHMHAYICTHHTTPHHATHTHTHTHMHTCMHAYVHTTPHHATHAHTHRGLQCEWSNWVVCCLSGSLRTWWWTTPTSSPSSWTSCWPSRRGWLTGLLWP